MPQANRRHLVIMAKDPVPGEVKTRLIPKLGSDGAASLYAAFLDDVLDASASPEWTATIAFAPAEARPRFEALARPGMRLLAQSGATLAERMIAVFEDLLRDGGPVVMRNSDSPTLPRRRIAEAFLALADPGVDAVFGPDLDGGYYLVGLKRPAPDLFRLQMSTRSMMQETLARAAAAGLSASLLAPCLDVDEPADLIALARDLLDPSTAAWCPRTAAWIRATCPPPPSTAADPS